VIRLRDVATGTACATFPHITPGRLARLRFTTDPRYLIVTQADGKDASSSTHRTQTWRIDPPGPVGPSTSQKWTHDLVMDDKIRILTSREGRAVAAILPHQRNPTEKGLRLRNWDLDADREVPGVALAPGTRGPG
jgi:hypothetical protein